MSEEPEPPIQIPETRTFEQVRDALIRLYHSPSNSLLAPSSGTSVERDDPLLDSDAVLPFLIRAVDEPALRNVIVPRQSTAATTAAAPAAAAGGGEGKKKSVAFSAAAAAAAQAAATSAAAAAAAAAAAPLTGKCTVAEWCNSLFPSKAALEQDRLEREQQMAPGKTKRSSRRSKEPEAGKVIFHYNNDPERPPLRRRFDAYVEAGPSCGKTSLAQQICREQPFEGAVAIYLPLQRIVYARRDIGTLRHLLHLALGGVVTKSLTAGQGLGLEGDEGNNAVTSEADDDDSSDDDDDDKNNRGIKNNYFAKPGQVGDFAQGSPVNHRINSLARLARDFDVESRFDPATNYIIDLLIEELSRSENEPAAAAEEDGEKNNSNSGSNGGGESSGAGEAFSVAARLAPAPSPSPTRPAHAAAIRSDDDDDDTPSSRGKKTTATTTAAAAKKQSPIPIVWVIDDLDAIDRSAAGRVTQFLQDFVSPTGRNAEFVGVLGSLFSTPVRFIDSILCFSRDGRRREACNLGERSKRFILERWDAEATQRALYAQISLKMSAIFDDEFVDYQRIRELVGNMVMSPEVFFGNEGPFGGSPYMVDIFAETVCMLAAPNVSCAAATDKFTMPTFSSLTSKMMLLKSPLTLFKQFLKLRWDRFIGRCTNVYNNHSEPPPGSIAFATPPSLHLVVSAASKLAEQMVTQLHCAAVSDSLLAFTLELNDEDDELSPDERAMIAANRYLMLHSPTGSDAAWAEALVQCGLLHKFQRRKESLQLDVPALRQLVREQRKEERNRQAKRDEEEQRRRQAAEAEAEAARRKAAAAAAVTAAAELLRQNLKKPGQAAATNTLPLAPRTDIIKQDDSPHSPSQYLKSGDRQTHLMFTSRNLDRINEFAAHLHNKKQEQQQQMRAEASFHSAHAQQKQKQKLLQQLKQANDAQSNSEFHVVYAFRNRQELEMFAALRFVGAEHDGSDQPPPPAFAQNIESSLPWHPSHRIIWLALASHVFHIERAKSTVHTNGDNGVDYSTWPYTHALCRAAASKFHAAYKQHRDKFSDSEIHSLAPAQLDEHQDAVYCALIVELTQILDPRYLLTQVEAAHGWHRKLPSHFFWMADQCGKFGVHMTLEDIVRRVEENGDSGRRQIPAELWARTVRNLHIAPLAEKALPPLIALVRTAVAATHELRDMPRQRVEVYVAESSSRKNMQSVIPNRALPPDERRSNEPEKPKRKPPLPLLAVKQQQQQQQVQVAAIAAAAKENNNNINNGNGAAKPAAGSDAGAAEGTKREEKSARQQQKEAMIAAAAATDRPHRGLRGMLMNKVAFAALDALSAAEMKARETLEHVCLATAHSQLAVGHFYFNTWVLESHVTRDLWNVGAAHKSGGNDVWFSTFAPLRRVVPEASVVAGLGLDERWAAQPASSLPSSSSSAARPLSSAEFSERLAHLETGLCYANSAEAVFSRDEGNKNKIRCRLALIEGPPHVGKTCFAQQLCVCQPCFGRVAIYVPFATVMQRHPQILDSIDSFMRVMTGVLSKLPIQIDFAVPFVWVLDDLDCVDRRHDCRVASLLAHFADAARSSSFMTARNSTPAAAGAAAAAAATATPRAAAAGGDGGEGTPYPASSTTSSCGTETSNSHNINNLLRHNTSSGRPHDLCIVVSRDLRENYGCFLVDTGASGLAEFHIERFYLAPWGPLLTRSLAFEVWRRLCSRETMPFADYLAVVERVCSLPAMAAMSQRPKLLSMVCRLVAAGQLTAKRPEFLIRMTPVSIFMMDLAERASGGRVPLPALQTLIANVAPIAVRSVAAGFPWRMTAAETADDFNDTNNNNNASFASSTSSSRAPSMPATPSAAGGGFGGSFAGGNSVVPPINVAGGGGGAKMMQHPHFIGGNASSLPKQNAPASVNTVQPIAGIGAAAAAAAASHAKESTRSNSNNAALDTEMESPDWLAHLFILGLVRQELVVVSAATSSRTPGGSGADPLVRARTLAGTPSLYTARGGSALPTPRLSSAAATPVDRFLEQEATHDIFINFSRRGDTEYLAAVGILEHATGFAAALQRQEQEEERAAAENEAATKKQQQHPPQKQQGDDIDDDDHEIEIVIESDDDDEHDDDSKGASENQRIARPDGATAPAGVSSPQPRPPPATVAAAPPPPPPPPAKIDLDRHTPPPLSINMRQAWLLAVHSASQKDTISDLVHESAVVALGVKNNKNSINNSSTSSSGAKRRDPVAGMLATVIALELSPALPEIVDDIIVPNCNAAPAGSALRTTMVMMSGTFGANAALKALLESSSSNSGGNNNRAVLMSTLSNCFVRAALHGESNLASATRPDAIFELLSAHSSGMCNITLPAAARLGSVPMTRWLLSKMKERPPGSDGSSAGKCDADEIALASMIALDAGDYSVLYVLDPAACSTKATIRHVLGKIDDS